MTRDQAELSAVVRAALADLDPQKLGLAVSGGGDSVAMLRLVASTYDGPIHVYSVDHGLRDGSAAEAQFVADLCAELNVPCRVLRWEDAPTGNLSASARRARYDLISEAAKGDGVKTVLLAHTKDDQAETVLMGLTRRGGVDGLSAMPAQMCDRGLTWLRPLLALGRDALRAYLRDIDQVWVDDPSNEDVRYERVRMRQAAAHLASLGLTTDALSAVAENMQVARAALEHATDQAWATCCAEIAGAVKIERAGFGTLPVEIQRRVLLRACRLAAPLGDGPRRDPLMAFLTSVDAKTTNMGGCLLLVKSDALWVTREPAAVHGLTAPVGEVWDGKWRVLANASDQNHVIRALGEDGLQSLPNWRDLGIPRQVLLTTPSVWLKNGLIAAPLVVHQQNWSAELI